MTAEYSKSYFVSAADANPEGELSVTSLASHIIDIATEHANSLGIGNPDMTDVGGGWVLARLTFEMEEYPPANSSIVITTWIEGWNRMFSTRCFEIADASGRVYGYARTVWMVIHLSRHTNLGLAHLHLPEGAVSGRECPLTPQGKHATAEGEPTALYRFVYSDLDYYRHVNTLKWIEILLDRYPLSTHDSRSVRRFEIAFMAEGRYGQEVEIYRNGEPDASTWLIAADGKPLVSARTVLAPRP